MSATQNLATVSPTPRLVDRISEPSADVIIKLDKALAEANPTLRSNGPGLFTIAGLILKEIFVPSPDRPHSDLSSNAKSHELR